MYVIVEIAGQQFKAEKGRKLYVHRLHEEENASVSFDKVLLTDNDGQVVVGTPVVEGAKVTAKVLKNGKGKKITVFTYKPKKNEKRKKGHRQPYTKVEITGINA